MHSMYISPRIYFVSRNQQKCLNIMTLNFRFYPLKMWAATNVIKSKPKFLVEINTMATSWPNLRLWNLKQNSVC